ncbi:hypothetical protein [Pseudoroseicyclus sp. CXY001]|uniref:hypothetical protein n=1 Tax=Pseudoroseicyclus sp. CXY001 TaxID=3242492 RepID=UPI00357106D9
MNFGEDEPTPDIFRAAVENDIGELSRALAEGQTLDQVSTNRLHMTPLHLACIHSSNDFLLAASRHKSFDPWARDDNMRTPWDHAAAKRNLEAQSLLLSVMQRTIIR